jgi:FkbM family methyltransferase
LSNFETGLLLLVLALVFASIWYQRLTSKGVIREVLRTQAAYDRRVDRLERSIQTGLERSGDQFHSIDLALQDAIAAREVLTSQHRALIERQDSIGLEVGELRRATLELAERVLDLKESQAQSHSHARSHQQALLTIPDWLNQCRLDRLQNDLNFIKNRLSSYLGNGTGLTYLVDETPIYINTNDFGCPSNFINGGRYEEEYQQVLASFRRPDSTFLDIGANLGVFSLRLAPMMRQGHVYAFEPNPKIHELFDRSVHLNGLRHFIDIFQMGASDRDLDMFLSVPDGHAGGATVTDTLPGSAAHSATAEGRIRVSTIDKMLHDVDQFHLAKIDVEGHELHALRGMSRLLARSPDAVILFEKLGQNTGIESDLRDLFDQFGMVIYRIDGVSLVSVDLAQFCLDQAYFLASRPARIGAELVRNFIDIYPADLYRIATVVSDELLFANSQVPASSLLFHGPYWYLPRGSWEVSVIGRIDTPLQIIIAENFGYPVADFIATPERATCVFNIQNDLSRFEVIGRALAGSVSFALQKIRLTRLG